MRPFSGVCSGYVAALFVFLGFLAHVDSTLAQSTATKFHTPADAQVAAARARGEAVDVDGDGDTDVVIPAARCNEGPFKPTVCWEDVPKGIKYRPTFEQCGGNAAILLSGAFSKSYSVVLRDRANRDRFPPCVRSGSNYGSCSFYQCDALGLNRCSAFKCQSTFLRGSGRTREKVCCLGDSGDSKVLSKATRMTIKLRDIPGSNLDPLVRVALKRNNPTLRLN